MTQLKKFRGSKDVFSVSAPALLRDGLVGELKRRYLDVSTKRKELAVTYLDSHPRIQALDQQSDQLLTLAARHVTAVYDAAAQQYRAAEAEERDIHQQLQAAQDEDRQVRQAKIEHDSLRARSEEDKMFYEKVAKRITETDLLRDIGVNNINILDLAVTPKAPVRPNVRLSLILGGLLALLVGVAVAFGVDALDNTVKNREDVEGLLHVPWLGSIPTFQAINPKEGLPVPEDRIDLYVHYRPNSLAAEAARAVRTNLLFMRPDNPARSILITSGSPREGKSSTSATLAITLAASTGRTILVDTDLRKPRLHKLFGVPGGQGGLTSYLLSHSPVDEFICKTDVPGLDFMPCGPLPPNPAELMHSDRFLTLKEELTAKYEVVLFDSSPVGLVTDPLVLASMCDGVVVVAHADQTRRESLRNTLGALKSVGAEILGVVLSRSTHLTGGYNYYYGGKAYGGDGDDQRYGYRYRYRYRYRRDPDQGDDSGEGDAPAGKS
jgi:capsular exopolysaccharide synthesis family protein